MGIETKGAAVDPDQLVAARFKPFSHSPGAMCIIPRTFYAIQAFPARGFLYDCSQRTPQIVLEIALNEVGPLDSFTVTQDLERNQVVVSGFSRAGFLCYSFYKNVSCSRGMTLHVHKNPLKQRLFELSSQDKNLTFQPCLKDSEGFEVWNILFDQSTMPLESHILHKRERLFLGCHKKQEFARIVQRADPVEFLPFCYYLAQSLGYFPSIPLATSQENSALVDDLIAAIEKKAHQEVIPLLKDIFKRGFHDLFFPTLQDVYHLGYPKMCLDLQNSSCCLDLLHIVMLAVRPLFFREWEGVIELAGCLPAAFHAGKMVHIRTQKGGVLHIEWTKHLIRRVWIETQDVETNWCFSLPKPIASFRVSDVKRKKTFKKNSSATLSLEKQSLYLLDQFQT